jgi:hypothetical protein
MFIINCTTRHRRQLVVHRPGQWRYTVSVSDTTGGTKLPSANVRARVARAAVQAGYRRRIDEGSIIAETPAETTPRPVPCGLEFMRRNAGFGASAGALSATRRTHPWRMHVARQFITPAGGHFIASTDRNW